MEDTIFWSRLQFAFTITYHYLFPQLTMGLAWIIVYFKWKHLRTGQELFGNAARFWARIFGINFAVGVVTDSAQLISDYIESFHEGLEEAYVLPRVAATQAGLVRTLLIQHDRGRHLTAAIEELPPIPEELLSS